MTPAEEMKKKARLERQAKLAELSQKWQTLLGDEKAAFMRCVELDNENHDRNIEKSEAVRRWWKIVSSVLWMFKSTRAEYDHELQPFPWDAFIRLEKISKELSNGIILSFVEDARSVGGRPLRLGERKDIAYGILYIEAVRRGEITDRAPNKTVRQAYNVTAKAVQGWVKRREEICGELQNRSLSPEKLKAKMLECGAVYSRIGRGAPSEN